ncbi:hypothetical protein NDU88_006404 [Pleurodeles waltl]|uniref:Uncharacterized protein n=1 Tax=Pleurodeles waltl TaxID=8319 RepID=A0AAV7TZF0_PLEWA|nr:hypothetical protein NDU88_006404 [Pleurodeles waltl]
MWWGGTYQVLPKMAAGRTDEVLGRRLYRSIVAPSRKGGEQLPRPPLQVIGGRPARRATRTVAGGVWRSRPVRGGREWAWREAPGHTVVRCARRPGVELTPGPKRGEQMPGLPAPSPRPLKCS